jgi:hypothetical protein
MRALVEASGLLEQISVTYQPKPPLATVVVRRVGREDATYTFGVDDAIAAGLAGRPMYAKYPKRMYVARAISFAMRDEFADVLSGVMGAEEMDESGEVITESEDFSGTRVVNASNADDPRNIAAEVIAGLMGQVNDELRPNIHKGFLALEYSEPQRLVALKEHQIDTESDGGAALYKRLREEYRQKLSDKLSAEVLAEIDVPGGADAD